MTAPNAADAGRAGLGAPSVAPGPDASAAVAGRVGRAGPVGIPGSAGPDA
jgi:hypothetical protein